MLGSLIGAVVTGGFTGAAGRVLHLFGLYDVLAALVLSIVAAALAHMTRLRPGPLVSAGLAVFVAVAWLGTHRVVDAALFRLDQAQAVELEAARMTQDFLAAGVDGPLELVDAGLTAETGMPGVRGAAVVLLRAGILVRRALADERMLPTPLWLHALVLACEAAFVAVVVRRALLHLATDPICTVCGRYLRRMPQGAVDADGLALLVQAWARGERPEVVAKAANAAVAAQVVEDACPAGHTAKPGFAAVRPRKRGLGRQVPGPLASLPAVAKAPESRAVGEGGAAAS